MAHTIDTKTNIISSIQLPNGGVYEIHDASAIHSVEELGLSAALIFQGTKPTDAEILAITSAKVGYVYLATTTNTEYVCVKDINGTANASAWEKLGNVHDAASSTHTHSVTVSGTNSESDVTGKVAVTTVSATQKYLTAVNSAPTVTPDTKSVLGADTTFSVEGGTATTSKMVTTTASQVTVANKTVSNVTENKTVTASKVSNEGSKTAGKAASWSASVNNGVLSFSWTANEPTEVTLPTFTEVTATNTTLGDAISVSSVTSKDVAVATGELATNGGGAAVATGVSAITVSAKNDNDVSALTGVTVGTSTITLTHNDASGNGAVPVVSGVTIGSANVSLQDGKAAAQTWTGTTTVGTPK